MDADGYIDMRRIFQHYTGDVPELEGLKIGHAKTLVNEDDQSIIVLWLSNRSGNIWYRIFIDGSYCGIDEYKADASYQDLDEGVKIENISSWFEDDRVLSVIMRDQKEINRLCLIIQFENQLCRLIYDSVSHHCSFERIHLQ
jgi:hypothetical protein